MNRLTKEDFDMLYWHATTKMRHGEFHSATQYFRYLFEERKSFHIGLAMAYCAYRDGEKQYASEILAQISPENSQDDKFYQRLLRRVSR